MALTFTVAVRNARADAITAAIGSNGRVIIYGGTPPANVSAALSSNPVLADLACSATFAPAASGGVLTANAITQDSSADATGTATFFRITTSGGTPVYQGSVSTSGADLNLNSTSIVAAGPVAVTSCVITEGGA